MERSGDFQGALPVSLSAIGLLGKKNGLLRPCFDYGALNNITVKNKYPLPLLDPIFSPLYKAQVFTKLDLHNV